MSSYTRFDDDSELARSDSVKQLTRNDHLTSGESSSVGESPKIATTNVVTIQSLHPAAESALSASRRRIASFVKWLHMCLVGQVAVATAIFLLSLSCTIRAHQTNNEYYYMWAVGFSSTSLRHYNSGCFYGVALWLSLPVLLSAGVGFASVTSRGRVRHRCLLIAYFVLAIVGCFLLFIIMLSSFSFAMSASHASPWLVT